jgi:uncharacterized protein YhbP (UPF0306 family)
MKKRTATRKSGLRGLPEQHIADAERLFKEAQTLRALRGCASGIEAAQLMSEAAQAAEQGYGRKAPIAKAVRREALRFRTYALTKCGF